VVPEAAAVLFGIAVVGAAFLLSVGAEVAQQGVSQALVLAFVALVAILPEYAVDFVFTWKAGQEGALGLPLSQQQWVHYAAANMTGANRLLVGLGWPLIGILYFLHQRRRVLHLEQGISLELLFLGLATLWAFTIIPLSTITLWHGAVFVALFGLYMWLSGKGEVVESELIGPAARVARLAPRWRRPLVVGSFLYAALVIMASAEPFATSLIETGTRLGVDEFIMAQWVAPLASESPEFALAVIFVLRHNAPGALITLISSLVNQWTLLVGTLPAVYSISLGSPSGLPLDVRQNEEVLLTAAQSLFALVLLVRQRMGWRFATALALLFLLQLFSPLYPPIPGVLPEPTNRHIYTLIYLALTGLVVLVQPGRLRDLGRLFPATVEAVRR